VVCGVGVWAGLAVIGWVVDGVWVVVGWGVYVLF